MSYRINFGPIIGDIEFQDYGDAIRVLQKHEYNIIIPWAIWDKVSPRNKLENLMHDLYVQFPHVDISFDGPWPACPELHISLDSDKAISKNWIGSFIHQWIKENSG